jgi:CPA2 family monovalent cation:H+ antiporter-2
MSGLDDLTHLALVALVAVTCGAVMTRLRQPAVVGYILAGILLGPSGVGLVTDRAEITSFAHLGVLLLLFMIGMELSLRGFRGVWRTAVVATLLQIAGSVGITLALAQLFDWSLGLAVLLGFIVAISSTAVVIKMLEGMNILRSPVAQVTVGVLIAQDLAIVPMMLTAGAIQGRAPDPFLVLKIVFSVAFLALLIPYLSRRKKIRLPFPSTIEGYSDLAALRGLALCFGAAAITGLAGLSPAYGAFLAGLIIGNSTERPVMLRSVRPIQSVLLMMFFLSVGLLIDLQFIAANAALVLLILGVIVIAKTVLNVGVLRLAGEPWTHAAITGILLAQIGEFSFVLGEFGIDRGIIAPGEGNLIVAVTALSLVISPLWLLTARRLLRIGILGVTSGHETLRLFLGRFAPALMRRGRGWDSYEPPAEPAAPEAAEAPVESPGVSPPVSSPCSAPDPGAPQEKENA